MSKQPAETAGCDQYTARDDCRKRKCVRIESACAYFGEDEIGV